MRNIFINKELVTINACDTYHGKTALLVENFHFSSPYPDYGGYLCLVEQKRK